MHAQPLPVSSLPLNPLLAKPFAGDGDPDLASPSHDVPESIEGMEARCRKELDLILDCLRVAARDRLPALKFEPMLWTRLLGLGRLLFVLWLGLVEAEVMRRLPGRWFRGSQPFERRGGQSRELGTMFGKVSYRRSYAYCDEAERGYYPTDEALGLTADGFTLSAISQACRLATRMSYEAATTVLGWFWNWAPATRTMQELTMGLGGHAHRFQERAAPPSTDEGDVLVIQFDSKGIPTATESELVARRGPRPIGRPPESSRRHRARDKRRQRGPATRRDSGDHSKNARMATLAVMYTLAQDPNSREPRLLGPRNVRTYASFSPKRYAFQVARREAEKRGFGPTSGRRIQFVYDGDEDLETYREQYFGDYPSENVVVTADIMHVLEYLWAAAAVLFPEHDGSRSRWVSDQKAHLLASEAELVRAELRARLGAISRTGPGTKAKREQLESTLRYLTNNAHRLDYKLVRAADLELASGMVEGAVRNLIGLRFDQGGMRWIAERAEALLQLRCIELNGQWDDFISWVHHAFTARDPSASHRLRSRKPPPLPTLLPPHLAVAHASAAKQWKS